jgi:arylsulfatase A-like enzyme
VHANVVRDKLNNTMEGRAMKNPVQSASTSGTSAVSGLLPAVHSSRRRFLFGMAATATALSSCGQPSSEAKPNIVLCMADDQGYGDVGYYGHPVLKTPVLDEMAATALRFDRFYSAAPVCSPTRGSVLTGRHPNRFACFRWGHTLRPQEHTIAKALRKAGYTSGHFGKWHVGEVRADSPVSPGAAGFDEWFSSPNFYENSPLMSHNGKVVETSGEGSQVTVDAAIRFIRRAHEEGKPFLAVIWFGSPHAPHEALDADRKAYEDQEERLQHFYGEITAMDRAIGSLRDELRALGIADNTLHWYKSDNGALPVGSTAGLRGRKAELEEGGIRVPAIIEWPARITQPRVTEVPCSTVDILPTLMAVAGVSDPVPVQPLDGISLLPLIEGEMAERPGGLGFWSYPAQGIPVRSHDLLKEMAREQSGEIPAKPASPLPEVSFASYPRDERPGPAAWIEGDYKLHRKAPDEGDAAATYALYHLGQDRSEQTDIAANETDRVARMKTSLEQWQLSVLRSLNGDDYRES